MNVKQLRARVQHKHKTEAEWYLDVYISAGSTELREDPFIPLDGELIIFEKDDTHENDRFKFGDGETNVMELSFASVEKADWNQDNPQASDYIKNRTHFDTGRASVIISDGYISNNPDYYDYPEDLEKPDEEKYVVIAGDFDGTWDCFDNVERCIPWAPGTYKIYDSVNSRHETAVVIEPTEDLGSSGINMYYDGTDPSFSIGWYKESTPVYFEGTIEYNSVVQLDAKYIPIDNDTIVTDDNGKLKANIPTDANTTYTLSKTGSTITLTGSDGKKTTVVDEGNVQGDWNQNDEIKADFIKNRTHYIDSQGQIVQLDAKYIPIDNDTLVVKSIVELTPGAYTDNTYTTLAYTWDELVARGNEVSYDNDIYPEQHQPCFIVDNEGYVNNIFATDHCVVVPEGVDNIGTEVGVKEIVLPASTTKMLWGEGVVDKIYIKATTPPPLASDDHFRDFNYRTDHYGVVDIVVPYGCGETYRTAPNWSQYADYITEGEMPQECAIKQVISANIQQTPADWDQNDPEASDYIKNRTHYYGLHTSETYTMDDLAGGGTKTLGTSTDIPFIGYTTRSEGGSTYVTSTWFKPGHYTFTCEDGGEYSVTVSKDGTTNTILDSIIVGNDGGNMYLRFTDELGTAESLVYIPLKLKQLDAKYIPIDNNTIITDTEGKLKANIPSDINTTYTLSKVDDEIILKGSDGNVTKVTDDKGSEGLVYKESFENFQISQPLWPSFRPENAVIAYGNNTVVCFAGNDTDYLGSYSKDGGQTWTTITNGPSSVPTSIAFGNDIFIAMLKETTIAYSFDGITWNNKEVDCTFAFLNCWRKVLFNNGEFILVGDYGYIATSTDGLSWTGEDDFQYAWSSNYSAEYAALSNNILVAPDGAGLISIVNLNTKEMTSSQIEPPYTFIYASAFTNNAIIFSSDLGYHVSTDNGQTWQNISDTPEIGEIFAIRDTIYGLSPTGSNLFYYDITSNEFVTTNTSVDFDSVYSIADLDTYLMVLGNVEAGVDLFVSNNGINWSNNSVLVVSGAYLEQTGTDVTSKVAKLVGGNGGGGNVDFENATLENLTITGALTIEGDLAFGDLDATTVTAEKITVENHPVNDNDVATKKYVDALEARIKALEDIINSITTLGITKDDNGQLTITE